jgi:4-amino-4-deoxy-L-arabinose transferase-like glycosyltransferase
MWRGGAEDPRWARPTLLALLLATAVLYLANLTASGWANDYYAAAAQAGSKSWTAWFFGGLDAGGAITVDKPPAAMWVLGLSMRVFGVNSAALLVPEALMGVATVALVYGTVRRLATSHGAGLLAAAATAVTPAAVLVFRFDNPDALLVLLLTAAGYCVVRALEDGRTRWLVLAGTAVGFGFLTKMGEALLVLPGLGAAYLLAGPYSWKRRLVQLGVAGVALVVSAGWYVAVTAVWPASSRPYIAGSTNNSFLELAFGYNGFARLLGNTGSSSGSSGGQVAGTFSGPAGITRLFRSEMAVEASWLLPAALVALLAGLWLTRRGARDDRLRAALVLWGGWLVVSGLVFSYMQGTIHPYYTAELAPALGALVATVGTLCWRRRNEWQPRAALTAIVAAAAAWSTVLLHRTSWGAQYAVGGLLFAIVVTLVMGSWSAFGRPGFSGRTRVLAATVGLAAILATGAGSTAWAVGSASSPQTGSSPTSGPAAAVSQNSFGGGGFRGPQTGSGTTSSGTTSSGTTSTSTDVQAPVTGSQMGGGDEDQSADAAVVQLLKSASSYRWAAATTSSMSAAPLQLASGASVMAIGGFAGDDVAPSLAQFQAWVAAGDVKYYISGAGGGHGGRAGDTGTASAIATWVSSHYTATTVGGVTVYDLQPAG